MMLLTKTLYLRLLMGGCILLSITLFIRQALITYSDSVQFGGSDLRVRIVGSRLMAAGKEPYFTKWQPGMSDYECDPNDTYDRPMNGLTVSPFLLWMQQPLARLRYPTIRLLWWAGQQMLYLFITALCLYCYRRSTIAVVVMSLCAAALANHPAWILHSERGQYYILLAAWVAILFGLWQLREKQKLWLVAAWLAFGILLRPTLLLFGVPYFLALRPLRNKIAFGAIVTASLLILLLLSGTWQYWPPYFEALELYVNRAIGRLHFTSSQTPLRPIVIEGATNITRYRRDIDFEYLKPLNYYLAQQGIWPGRKLYLLVSVVLNGGLLLLTYLKTRFRLIPEQMLMLGILLYTATDFCQPFRASYSIVIWLPATLVAVGYSLSGLGRKDLFAMTENASF